MVASEKIGGVGSQLPYIMYVHQYSGYVGKIADKYHVVEPHVTTKSGWGKYSALWEGRRKVWGQARG